MKSKYKLPLGVKDYLMEECFSKAITEDNMVDMLKNYGFRQIDTPSIERYEMFSSGAGAVSSDKLFKFTDLDGDLLVLRPDMTLPISRIVSTKLDGKLLKLCYKGKSFALKNQNNELREFSQVGVEIVGINSPIADAESISLAIKCLLNSGLDDFLIDMGQVGYFKGLLSELNLDYDSEKELINLINKKDMLGLEFFAKKNITNLKIFSSIMSLPLLFGGVEVVEIAKKENVNEECNLALDNLLEIYNILVSQGYEKYLSIDLSLVNGVSYYSGVVFKGISKYFGGNILSGGRYDNLANSFEKYIPCTGFAVGVDNLVNILTKIDNLPKYQPLDVVVGYDELSYVQAKKIIEEQISLGKIVDNSFLTDKIDFIEYLKELKYIKAIFVADNKVEEV